MTITHHPSDVTLAAFASGTLDESRGLVVAAHLSLCARCRNAVRSFEQVGGVLLEAAEPAVMTDGALERAMCRLGQQETIASPVGAALAGTASDLPAPLSRYSQSP